MKTGIAYEWINGKKPHLIKDGIRIICNTENFFPIVVPGLSSSSSTVSEIQVGEREDATNSDISPVPMSNLVDDGSAI